MRFVVAFALFAGCATRPPAPPEARDVAFARAHLERTPQAAEAPVPSPARPATVVKPFTEADEIDGLVTVTPAWRAAAADPAAVLAQPVSPAELAALAWLRSPDVKAARDRLAAARTGYRQSEDLADLVAIYRAFVRDTKTRVGPEKSRAPAPLPDTEALSGEIVRRTVAIAFRELRGVVVELVVMAERAHADAARLAAARRVLAEDVALHESLVAVARARFESGRATQSGLLALEARLATLRNELAILQEQEHAVRARWNRLLHRPEDAPVNLGVAPAPAPAAAEKPFASARAHAPRHGIAVLMAERADFAVRLGETMTLGRFDIGSSRFERERAADEFPAPGRMVMPRADFGVREAQLLELRARRDALKQAVAASNDRLADDVRAALFSVDAAQRRLRLHENELVPLAARALETTRGAYEGARTGYLELIDAARGLLKARLGRVDAERALAHAHATLLAVVGTGRTKS